MRYTGVDLDWISSAFEAFYADIADFLSTVAEHVSLVSVEHFGHVFDRLESIAYRVLGQRIKDSFYTSITVVASELDNALFDSSWPACHELELAKNPRPD